MGPKESRVRWDPDPMGRGNFGEGAPIVKYRDFLLCKNGWAEPINLPFGLWTRVGRRKHKFNRIHQVAPMCHYGRAHWRHLTNTTEPSVYGGDVALINVKLL